MGQQYGPVPDERLRARLAPDEFSALSMYCANTRCGIRLVRWLGGGKSRAKLAEVFINDSHGFRKRVLKYCPSGDTPATDFLAFKRASKSGPRGFARAHLVGIDRWHPNPITSANGLFLLMESHTGGKGNYDTMAVLLGSEILGSACERIISSTVDKWNSGKDQYRQSDGELNAKAFLQEIVGGKCDPGGSILLAADELKIPTSEPCLSIFGQLLPNPLAMMQGQTQGDWLEDIHVAGLRGNAHGDLHPDNILIPQVRGADASPDLFDEYVLIDLSTFSNERLIAVDPAHLLLAIIARSLTGLPPQARDRLFYLVLDPELAESGEIPVALVQATRAIHSAGVKFATSRDRDLYEEWILERLIAIAGCALLFVGRGLPREDCLWFLNLAAKAIEKLETVPRQHDGLVVDDGEPPAPGPGTLAQTAPVATSSENGLPASVPEPVPDSPTGVPSQAEEAPPPEPDQKPVGHDDEPAKVAADPPEAPVISSPTDLVMQQHTTACGALTAELAAEISDIGDDLSAGEAYTATITARAILEELSAALKRIEKWCNETQIPWRIAYVTAVGSTRVELNEVAGFLAAMTENGTSRRALEDLEQAVGEMRHRINEVALIGMPARRPMP